MPLNPFKVAQMSKRSTRNKLRFQLEAGLGELRKGQIHLGQLAALADDRSDYIDKHLPIIMAALESVIEAVDAFGDGL